MPLSCVCSPATPFIPLQDSCPCRGCGHPCLLVLCTAPASSPEPSPSLTCVWVASLPFSWWAGTGLTLVNRSSIHVFGHLLGACPRRHSHALRRCGLRGMRQTQVLSTVLDPVIHPWIRELAFIPAFPLPSLERVLPLVRGLESRGGGHYMEERGSKRVRVGAELSPVPLGSLTCQSPIDRE